MDKSFKWTIEIEIDPGWVADGFDVDDGWVQDMLMQMLSGATCYEVNGRVIKRPALASIMKEQGYSKANIASAIAAGVVSTRSL